VIIVIACLIAIAAIAFILGVRPRDLPEPEAESPFAHLDERKAAIYENLRDLQFEYRVGKLSDADYQNTKKDLQKELAAVLAEVDRVRAVLNGAAPPKVVPDAGLSCPACGAKFEKQLKFCGECGKPMKAASA
jgi:NADH pyrophosphatase NudC (nudix superfamily)